jgi:hypothetical protein
VRARLIAALVALLLLMPAAARAQTSVAGQPAIGLGYGPLSIQPVSVGTPIYVSGDSLWAESYLNNSATYLSLTPPGSLQQPTQYLGPGSISRIYTFGPTDPVGIWQLEVTTFSPSSSYTINITLASPAAQVAPQFVGANVTGNTLGLQYSLPATNDYDIQACTIGSNFSSSATYTLPAGLGGEMTVALSGGDVSVSSTASSAFSAWFELYAPRSYVEGDLVYLQQTQVAQTRVLTVIGGAGAVNGSLVYDMNQRPGRYELRSYVRTAGGLTVFDGQFLMANSWISLSRCTEMTDLGSGPFDLASSLDATNSTWPRLLYLMYEEGGVEGFDVSGIPAAEARIDVRGVTSSDRLPGVQLVASGAGIGSWDAFDSGVYILGTFPLQVALKVDYEGVASQTFNLTIATPYTYQLLRVPAGTLRVRTTEGGAELPNATFTISLNGSEPVNFRTDNAGNATFILPPGTYTLVGSSSGRNTEATAQVEPGGEVVETLNLGGRENLVPVYLLGGLLVAGLGLDYLVWRAYIERRATLR